MKAKRMYFFVRKNGRVICEHISMTRKQTVSYLSLLRDLYGGGNVLASSNNTCMAVQRFTLVNA